MIYIYLAQGFEEIEALTPVDMLRRCGADIKLIGVGSKNIVGAHGIEITCDMIIGEETYDDSLEMIILPGGMPGTLNLEKCENVQKAIDFAVDNNLYIAAICAAPMILGNRGLLNGKNAVCYMGFEKYLKGADVPSQRVCVCDNFITAVGMGAAAEFSLELVKLLYSQNQAEELKCSTLC